MDPNTNWSNLRTDKGEVLRVATKDIDRIWTVDSTGTIVENVPGPTELLADFSGDVDLISSGGSVSLAANGTLALSTSHGSMTVSAALGVSVSVGSTSTSGFAVSTLGGPIGLTAHTDIVLTAANAVAISAADTAAISSSKTGGAGTVGVHVSTANTDLNVDVSTTGNINIKNAGTGNVLIKTLGVGAGILVTTSTNGFTINGSSIEPTGGSTNWILSQNSSGHIVMQSASTLGLATTSLTNGHIYVGNGSGIAGDVAMSGDVTISNAGVTTLKNTGTAATVGDATHVAAVTTDAQGRVTGMSATAITGLAESAITGLVTDLAAKAPLASPALTGTPTAPTATAATSTTQIATTAFVTTADNLKANLASPALTGTPTAPTATPGTNSTQLATTAYADAIAALKANIASPTFTGTPAAPTASRMTNTTQLATTAYADRVRTVCTSSTHPGSPSVGDEIYETDTGNVLFWVGATDGWRPPWNTAWGFIGQGITTTDNTPLAVSPSVTNVSGATVTFTAVANRRYKVSYVVTGAHAADGNTIEVFVVDGSGSFIGGDGTQSSPANGVSFIIDSFLIESPAAGSITRKLQARTNTGTATLQGSTHPGLILVEDIGPNGNPS